MLLLTRVSSRNASREVNQHKLLIHKWAVALQAIYRGRGDKGVVFLKLIVAAITMTGAPKAIADWEEGLGLRSAVGLSSMVSKDQLNTLGYDQVGFVGDAQLVYSVLPWLDPYGGVIASAFVASQRETGGLVAPNVGVMASIRSNGFRPYTQTDIGVGFTGAIVRPLFRAGIGIDISLSNELSFGPTIGYGQLFHPNTSTSTSDARFIWAGCSLLYRYQIRKKTPTQKNAKIVRSEPSVTRRSITSVEPSPELLELIERTLPAPDIRVQLLAPVLFALNSDELEPVGVAMLHEVAFVLKQQTDIALVEIQGYADTRGSTVYNHALSLKRAQRVYDWLIVHGIEKNRLKIAGLGATHLVETATTEQGHQQNRRVVFRVLKLREP